MNIKFKKGFTLVEIIAASLIITIASLGTFSAYALARRFSNKFAYKSQATKIAAAVADELRYRNSFNDDGTDPLNLNTALQINDANGNGDPTDDGTADTVNTYYIFDASGYNEEGLLTGLTAKYVVSQVWFVDGAEQNADPNLDGVGGTVTPGAFKKITVTVGWTEPVQG